MDAYGITTVILHLNNMLNLKKQQPENDTGPEKIKVREGMLH